MQQPVREIDMPTLFTKIILGEIPAHFVWRDERAVCFLSINPLRPGHALVVPRDEVDHWLDLKPDLTAHLTAVAQSIGKAIQRAFGPKKVGLIIAGLEVPHVHLHLIPIHDLADLDFQRAEKNPPPGALQDAATKIRSSLRELGYPHVSE